jgi:hypothetical protein
VDDAADPSADPRADGNGRVLLRCTALTADSGTTTVDVLIGGDARHALLVDGNLTFSGNASIGGGCGSVHANGSVAVGGTNTRVGSLSATGAVAGIVYDTTGGLAAPQTNAAAVRVPDLDPMSYCGSADYLLRTDGYVVKRGTPEIVVDARTISRYGWKRTNTAPLTWTLDATTATTGTACAEGTGNVVVSGNLGTETAPLRISILAGGSISVSGSPFIAGASADSILLMAGGDVSITGTSSLVSANYEGLIYARGQCLIAGNPRIGGELICKDRPNTAGMIDYAATTTVSGNPTLAHGCGGWIAGKPRVKTWLQPVGT